MTAIAVRTRVTAWAVPADAVALASVAALSILVAALTWGTWGNLAGDTGYDFVAGARLADGAIPYDDYVYYYGPLAPVVTALAVLIGGNGLVPMIALGLAIAAAVVASTYALVRTHAGPLGAALAAAITVPVAFAPNQFGYVLPHTGAATLGLLCVLLTLLALERAQRTASPRWALAAGAAAGLSTLTKPEFAVATVAAGAVWAVTGRRRRDAVLFAAPMVVLAAGVYGALAARTTFTSLVTENLYPVDFFETAGNTMLDARFPLTAASIVELAARLSLYGAACAALVLASRAAGRHWRAGTAIAAVGGAAAAMAAIANPEALRHGLQYAYGWIPAGALIAVWVLRRRPEASAEAMALAAVAASTYATFFLYSHEPQMAMYAAPLAASLLVRLHLRDTGSVRAAGAMWLVFLAAAGLGLTLKDAAAQSGRVQGSGGTLYEVAGDAPAYQGAVDWIERSTAPGEAILLAPQLTALYAVTERENPLRWLSLLPGTVAGSADEREAIAQLERANVRFAVVDRTPFTAFGHTSFGASFNREVDAWIRTHLSHAATLRGTDRTLEIWRRGT